MGKTCKRSTCTNEANGDGYSGKFCSDMCELKHEHIKAEAREARAVEREQLERRDYGEPEGPPY